MTEFFAFNMTGRTLSTLMITVRDVSSANGSQIGEVESADLASVAPLEQLHRTPPRDQLVVGR